MLKYDPTVSSLSLASLSINNLSNTSNSLSTNDDEKDFPVNNFFNNINV